jgi:cobalt-zinc-cadmium efflux system membrane fusion protein
LAHSIPSKTNPVGSVALLAVSRTSATELQHPRLAGRVPGRWLKLGIVLGLGALLASALWGWGAGFLGSPAPAQEPEPSKTRLGVELVPNQPHTLAVSEEVRKTLKILKDGKEQIAVASRPVTGRALTISGSTALDPAGVFRVRARFAPAEVVQVMQVEEPNSAGGPTILREIRSGDSIRKGDILGVFFSVDVGTKKNDLIDALVKLDLDRELLQRAESAVNAVPEILLLNARSVVQSDENAIARTVNTLRTWGIPEADIQAVRDEAATIAKNHGKRDKEKESQWARVELRAPASGVLIERNVTLHEVVVDGTTNLFVIANVDRLAIFANAPEDDLPELHALDRSEKKWTIRTVGAKPIAGEIDDIGVMIDPNQHTAVVRGHIENPRHLLHSGQFASATVLLPAPADVVEVPITAIVEDGRQCLVFVQADSAKPHFTLRRVVLANRFDRSAFVRSVLSPEQARLTDAEKEDGGYLPPEALRPGERVLTTGVMELKSALEDKESSSPTSK